MIKENQIIFTYLHLAAAKKLTEGLVKSKSVCIAYETVTDNNGRLPLLAPMSAVAGRMSIQAGAHSLEKNQKGRGILLGGAPGCGSCYSSYSWWWGSWRKCCFNCNRNESKSTI